MEGDGVLPCKSLRSKLVKYAGGPETKVAFKALAVPEYEFPTRATFDFVPEKDVWSSLEF